MESAKATDGKLAQSPMPQLSTLNMMSPFEGVALVQLDIAESCTKPAGAHAVWGKGVCAAYPIRSRTHNTEQSTFQEKLGGLEL